MNFNGILIGSDDAERLAEFYGKLLGEPAFKDESYTSWQIGSGSVSIGPHSEVKGRNASPGRIIWNIETTDVKGEAERFKAAGAAVVAEPYSFVSLKSFAYCVLVSAGGGGARNCDGLSSINGCMNATQGVCANVDGGTTCQTPATTGPIAPKTAVAAFRPSVARNASMSAAAA